MMGSIDMQESDPYLFWTSGVIICSQTACSISVMYINYFGLRLDLPHTTPRFEGVGRLLLGSTYGLASWLPIEQWINYKICLLSK